jgi:hypothetical protein
MAGWGTITGSVSNPMVVQAMLNQTVDGIQGYEPFSSDTTITLNAAAVTS